MQDASLQESMGPIVDRTKENLVSTDNGIIMARHRLMRAAKALARERHDPARRRSGASARALGRGRAAAGPAVQGRRQGAAQGSRGCRAGFGLIAALRGGAAEPEWRFKVDKRPAVIVAGGGIGGLAAALGLADKGCNVTVLEQADHFGEIGAGIQIGPNAFHAMDYLGVGDAGRAKAVYIDRLIMMDGMTGGRSPKFLSTNRSAGASAIPTRSSTAPICTACCSMPAGRTTALRSSTSSGSSATSTTPTGRRSAPKLARCSKPTPSSAATASARKSASSSRAAIRCGCPAHVAYRAVLPIEQMPEDLRWNAATLWAGPKCHMVHYPLQGWKTFNLVATSRPRWRASASTSRETARKSSPASVTSCTRRASFWKFRPNGGAGFSATASRSRTGPRAG